MRDKDRLENLKIALHTQINLLKQSYDIQSYIRMSEHASNIEKLSYTIEYLQTSMKESE